MKDIKKQVQPRHSFLIYVFQPVIIGLGWLCRFFFFVTRSCPTQFLWWRAIQTFFLRDGCKPHIEYCFKSGPRDENAERVGHKKHVENKLTHHVKVYHHCLSLHLQGPGESVSCYGYNDGHFYSLCDFGRV